MGKLPLDKYRLFDLDNGIGFSSRYHEATVTESGEHCYLVVVCLEDGDTYEVDKLPLHVANQVIVDLIRQANSGVSDNRFVSRMTKYS